ncbi:MAG: SPFH domain-containing protein [Spirochaetaceae bacterium]|jgi:regulator of protease activity HflC (stomatin/prohibitin superfamily)|nr:SPFH domain-containing protein [Spirochaetaceae bacterium]
MFGIIVLIVFVIITLLAMVKIVPEQEAWIIEQFGKYRKTLAAGLHLIIPFVQKASYKINLKEEVIDVAPQVCITNDNVQVTVDGILYLKVMDPQKAAYGIENYRYATSQLAQTTMRSEIGKIELDNTFSERDTINDAIVKAVDQASDPWGIKVTRYEIKNLEPSDSVREAMEQQMTAEREKRADVLESDGMKLAEINHSKGVREESINLSKGERQRTMNVAEGRAKSIEIEASATAKGIKMIAEVLQQPNAERAKTLRIMDQYVSQMGNIFQQSETTVLPVELSQVRSIIQGIAPGLKLGGDK